MQKIVMSAATMTGQIWAAPGRHVGGCCDAHEAGQGTATTDGDGKGLEAVGDIEPLVRLLQEVQVGEAGNKRQKTEVNAVPCHECRYRDRAELDGRRPTSTGSTADMCCVLRFIGTQLG